MKKLDAQPFASNCRVCLTTSKNLTPLSNSTNIEDAASKNTIQDILESVTKSKIIIDPSRFPHQICQMCLSLLKLAHEFQTQFAKSQEKLENEIGTAPIMKVEEEEEEEVPSVELIFGESKVDLKNVLIVEEEGNKENSFEGFLKNLGSEVTAEFVRDEEELKIEIEGNVEDSVVIEKIVKPEEEFQLFEENETILTVIYECDHCKSLFDVKSELDEHVEICIGPSPQLIQCELCGHMSTSASSSYRHQQKHKGIKYPCEICGKSYTTRTHLRVHLGSHQNKRQFLCNICGKNFNYANALKYHMRLHTGEKKYVCNFCGLSYRMPNTLKRHIRTHTKEKPYKCNFCHKGFSSCGEMKSHQMLHTGEKPYECKYCGQKYIKSCNLQYHYFTHSGPHSCYLCPRTFIEVQFLRSHLKKSHDVQFSCE